MVRMNTDKRLPVSRASAIVLAGVLLVSGVSSAAAGSSKHDQVIDPDGRSSYAILSTLRMLGLDRISQPARRGPYYVLHAYDPFGIEMRVVADAQFGDILSIGVADILNTAYTPLYVREPRIIHVQQPDDPAITPPAAR